ncbi:MAG: thioredoxin [Bacteroidales bacterium]|jgi:hypothetical protein|nr:thioredoxin [Bacteroidales bacterium]
MKNLLFSIILLLAMSPVFAGKPVRLKVVYFHSEHRCPTCISIEENTKKVLNTYYAKELKEGTITFVSLDVEEKQNLKMVEKYEAEGSSLYLTGINNSKETTTDLTNFAFSYSRNQPEKFMTGLKAEIEKKLK